MSLKTDKKSELRNKFRQGRRSLQPQKASQASIELCHHIQQSPLYINSQKIACFLSFDGEIDTKPLIEQLLKNKSCVYLPKIKPYKPNRLWFLPYQNNSPLKPNRYGIQEVDLGLENAIGVSKLDVILMPLVAFDSQGNRLGMGGGYYDATLAHLKDNKVDSRPKCIGLAFAEQQIERLPRQNWDIPLDGVFTQKGFISFS